MSGSSSQWLPSHPPLRALSCSLPCVCPVSWVLESWTQIDAPCSPNPTWESRFLGEARLFGEWDPLAFILTHSFKVRAVLISGLIWVPFGDEMGTDG